MMLHMEMRTRRKRNMNKEPDKCSMQVPKGYEEVKKKFLKALEEYERKHKRPNFYI